MTKKEVTDIKVIDKKTSSMLKTIKELDVTDALKVAEMTSNIKTMKTWVKQEKDKYVKPAKDIIAKAKIQYDPIITLITDAEKQFKAKVTKHIMDQRAIEEAKKEKLVARVERGTMTADTAVRKMEEVGETEKSTGGVTIKMIRDYEIVDESLIPDKYFDRVLRKGDLRKDVLTNNIEVPGTKVIEKPSASF